MDLKKEILKEHAKVPTLRIVQYVGNDPDRFAKLMSVFQAGPYLLTARSAWPISVCVEAHPELAKPYLKMLLKVLDKKDQDDSVKRNIMRLLQFVTIPKHLQGIAVKHAFRFLKDPSEAISVRVFSMTVLANIAAQQPDLKNELLLLLEDQLPYGSAGFVSRARKTIKQLTREKQT